MGHHKNLRIVPLLLSEVFPEKRIRFATCLSVSEFRTSLFSGNTGENPQGKIGDIVDLSTFRLTNTQCPASPSQSHLDSFVARGLELSRKAQEFRTAESEEIHSLKPLALRFSPFLIRFLGRQKNEYTI
jgi:hypothetical protein